MAESKKPRCSARRVDGQPCRAWASRQSLSQEPGRPLCIMHMGGLRRHPQDADRAAGRACTATTRQGQPCRLWAVKGTDPPLCRNHRPRLPRPRPAQGRQRCQATKNDGTRCRGWVWRNGPQGQQATLCNVHAGRLGRRGPASGPRRCTARNAHGQRCSRWALGEAGSSPGKPGALCHIHALRGSVGPPPQERRCTATTLEGRRCNHWVLNDGPQGEDGSHLCQFHAHPGQHPGITHGYYRQVPWFSQTEALFIRACIRAGHPLALQLIIMRLKLRDLLAYLNRPELSAAQRVRVAHLILRACDVVTDLLLARQKLAQLHWTSHTAGSLQLLLDQLWREESNAP